MLKIICVGKLKDKSTKLMVNEYLKRLGAYTKIELIEVNDEMAPQSNSEAENEIVKIKEGERILTKIKDQDYMILLDLWGEMLDSLKFAKKMDEITTYHSSNITFVIGGSLGISKQVVERANFRWKMSDLTFTHQLVRVLLLEQIYRSYKINNNETYHK
ncbi:MAG: 23S rRNA (pseudouridine(1915)-N(3))-methyltransferase RlmH [Erysipelotrichaceae bacterium]